MREFDCLLCQIALGDRPSQTVFKDDQVLAIRDINPQAPTHVLIFPTDHMESLNDAAHSDEAVLGKLLRIAAKVANQLQIAEEGYRVVLNTGTHGGQTVPHIHLHLLGGRAMTWPPG
ncbi:MAG: histidine triad nucleotide-binding protein [Acidobacteria bacterium]|nr:histidine triad nucleotide-binding protein [Acidobacteriota bacterium]